MVGAVGKMASVKRCGLCCSSSAIETRPGPSSLLEERIKTPIVFVVFFVLSATSQTGGNGKGIWINRDEINLMPLDIFCNASSYSYATT